MMLSYFQLLAYNDFLNSFKLSYYNEYKSYLSLARPRLEARPLALL